MLEEIPIECYVTREGNLVKFVRYEKIQELEEEIERQKEIIKQLDIKNLELTTIIKEVRERLMKANIYRNYDDDEDDTWYTDLNIDEVLEILDKVDKEKE